jgi:hypothetical protein
MSAVKPVTDYNYQFHGGPNGYGGYRAVLRLQNAGTSVAYVYFIPTGQPIPADADVGSPAWIRIYMPEATLPGVIDMLRNEKPISVYFASGSGFLLTGNEPVGESE